MPKKKTTQSEETGAQKELQYERSPSFVSAYANNVYFESSAWDLKIVFGQLEQPPSRPAVIKQHTAVTIPWSQAKLALYYLRLHVEANEIQHGKIAIPQDLLPPEATPVTEEQRNDPRAKQFYELVRKLRTEFIESL